MTLFLNQIRFLDFYLKKININSYVFLKKYLQIKLKLIDINKYKI